MMEKIKIDFTDCYGIRSLTNEFSFEKAPSHLIYAPNGVMKTSFAKSFKRISEGKQPEELIYNRQSTCSIAVDGNSIKKEQVLVVEPFNQNVDEKNISTLLVNTDLKAKYDALLKTILDAKKRLSIELNRVSKIKKDEVENRLCSDFNSNDIFDAIKKLQEYNNGINDYSSIEYEIVFDSKVLELLKDGNIASEITRYIAEYNKLLQESKIFVKDVFNPVKASSISNTLSKENYFKAKHKLALHGIEELIESESQLNDVLNNECKVIQSDPKLQAISSKILNGVNSIKAFQEVLSKSPELAADLGEIDSLRKKFWKSYYNANKEIFDGLLNSYNVAKNDLIFIENQASIEGSLWFQAMDEFKLRFHMPFEMIVENEKNSILGTTAPNVKFKFVDESGRERSFNRGQLNSLDVLSIGERRALYLLYVIFEFKVRHLKNQETIIVVDDIADSFDYKNKYAIIEYLKEISELPCFRLIVLTHNFDFYRTYQSRVLDRAKWDNSHLVESENGNIRFLRGGNRHVSDPFSIWKKMCHSDDTILISMIPFVRNLIEFKEGTNSAEYAKLTSMLHAKSDSNILTISDLWTIITNTVRVDQSACSIDMNAFVVPKIFEVADRLSIDSHSGEFLLERKICLSIGIRIKAEQFMFTKIAPGTSFSGNQTGLLFNKFIEENEHLGDSIISQKKTLGRVVLMTPENIHINSFMYEPLVDLSDKHLKELYQEVSDL